MKDTLEAAELSAEARAQLLARPDAVLEDRDLMRALVAANDEALGENVVDMRGLAMRRLEERLERLEDTYSAVISAAHENLAGTRMIHSAALCLLEAADLDDVGRIVAGPLAETLRLDHAILVLEGGDGACEGGAVRRAPPGWVARYLSCRSRAVPRRVTLRPISGGLYGGAFEGSEACLALDLGPHNLPGMLAFAIADRAYFHPGQGTDLLEFLAGAAERLLKRVLP